MFSADGPHEYHNGGKDFLPFVMFVTVEGIRTGETSAAHTDDDGHEATEAGRPLLTG